MPVALLKSLYEYSRWANRQLFAVLGRLTDEEFTRDVAGSYGSVRHTLVHMMSAEVGWVDRCGGPPRSLPMGALLQHAMIHGVHHRGQVALLLRALGQAPGNFDLLFYETGLHAPERA